MSIIKASQMAVMPHISFAIMDLQKEHDRSYIFIKINRDLTANEIFKHLQDSNLPNIPSRTTVFERFLRFQDGGTSLDGIERF